MVLDIEILRTLTESGNPIVNIFAIIGLSFVIGELYSIKKTREKVSNHDMEIRYLNESINEIRTKLSRLEDKPSTLIF